MPRKGCSYYIETEGPDDTAYFTGMAWLLTETERTNSVGLVAASGLQNLRNLHWSQIGPICEALATHGTHNVGRIVLRLFTLRTNDLYSWNGPVLILMGTGRLWDKVDALDGNADVLLVPWNREQAQGWIDTWDAQELNASQTEPERTSDSECSQGKPIWQIALDRLTCLVNLGTGIIHPSDKQQAILTLETLYYKHQLPDGELVRQYLVRSGWRPQDARECGELASRIGQGRRPKGAAGSADEGLWRVWAEHTQ